MNTPILGVTRLVVTTDNLSSLTPAPLHFVKVCISLVYWPMVRVFSLNLSYFDDIIYLYNYKLTRYIISADCKKLFPMSNVIIEESQLPVKHEAEIDYSCPKRHTKKEKNVKAICRDGLISFSDGSLYCYKIGQVYFQVL